MKRAKQRVRLARIIVDLPKDYSIWRVIAVRTDEFRSQTGSPPIDCQIVGPVAFMFNPAKSKKRIRRAVT